MYKNELLRAVKGITECDGGYTGRLRTIRSLHMALGGRCGNVNYQHLDVLLMRHMSGQGRVPWVCGMHGA